MTDTEPERHTCGFFIAQHGWQLPAGMWEHPRDAHYDRQEPQVSAVQYAGLVGKYIRMERPAAELEQAAGDPPTIGMECTVTQVYDSATPGVVMICSDYGYAFAVGAGQPVWRFSVWPDEATAKGHR